jgi:hypothetical protein
MVSSCCHDDLESLECGGLPWSHMSGSLPRHDVITACSNAACTPNTISMLLDTAFSSHTVLADCYYGASDIVPYRILYTRTSAIRLTRVHKTGVRMAMVQQPEAAVVRVPTAKVLEELLALPTGRSTKASASSWTPVWSCWTLA